MRARALWWALAVLAPADLPAAEARRETLIRWERTHSGVRYGFGHCTSRRMDCSCFVQRLFADRFGLALPRTTLDQARVLAAHRIDSLRSPSDLHEESLCAGDLIYTYRSADWRRGSRHVAVYLGDGQVVHSSSQLGGVGISDLDLFHTHRLYGVYRPLGCETGAPASPTRPSLSSSDSSDEGAVRGVIARLFRAWEQLDSEAYRGCWRADAEQWRHGRRRLLDDLLADRRRRFDELSRVRAHHRIESLSLWGAFAVVEVAYTLELTYLDGRRGRDRGRESYLLARTGAEWLITHNEIELD